MATYRDAFRLRLSGWDRGVVATVMGIKKQEFYEGAALHLLIRGGRVASVRYKPPFFTLNDQVVVLIKYSTKGRSPWGFTFTVQERRTLMERASSGSLYVALVCGADGVVALNYEGFRSLIPPLENAVRIACFRDHREHYRVCGPVGTLDRKVSRTRWQKLLDEDNEGAT